MSDPSTFPSATTPGAPSAKPKTGLGKSWTYAILIVALLFVMMPFLFWNATWFGRPLTDAQLGKALTDHQHAREIQHAMTQIELRMEHNDPAARIWYPQLVNLARDPLTEIRVTDAWVMGQDNSAPEFHDALRKMLDDPQPMVRRNAALSLVRFKDDSGHAQIVDMLKPYAMPVPQGVAGTIRERLKPRDTINPGTMVARVETADSKKIELRANVPGTLMNWTVADGSAIQPGQTIVMISPDETMVWESLRALYLIGTPEDAAAVEPYARGIAGLPPQIQQQATLTLQKLRGAATSNSSS
jgi:hypothetical protein